jgi:hypothetical protein
MARYIRSTLCDKVCQLLAACQLYSPGTPVSPTNKTDRYDITGKELKVALNTITLTLNIEKKKKARIKV